MEVGDQPCVFRHDPENERKSIVTGIAPVFVYRTHHSPTAYYRMMRRENSLFVLASTSKAQSLEKWTPYLPDTQVQDTKHEERRTCEWQTKAFIIDPLTELSLKVAFDMIRRIRHT